MSRLLLCDDHAVFVDALAMALAAGGEDVVAVTRSVPQALAEARATEPDIVLMDLHFGAGPDGLLGLRMLRNTAPAPKVILLSGAVDGAVLADAVAAGADGVVSKAEPLEVLLTAVRRVADGSFYADPDVMLQSMRPATTDMDLVQLSAQFLTPREREVLGRLAQGASTQDMASAMGVGIATVRTHVQAVLSKLGVGTRLEAVTLAIAHGLHEPPQRRAVPQR
ncbi:MAG: two component transcriptional regulator, LuxR family [Blastococcus sp.]|nr:two component transcriptional regulator, LuxR family [Blastococcus sp.]